MDIIPALHESVAAAGGWVVGIAIAGDAVASYPRAAPVLLAPLLGHLCNRLPLVDRPVAAAHRFFGVSHVPVGGSLHGVVRVLLRRRIDGVRWKTGDAPSLTSCAVLLGHRVLVHKRSLR